MRKFEDHYLIQRNFTFDSSIKLNKKIIKGSVEHCYETLDMIDQTLVSKGSPKLSGLVELANLSSIVGNLLGAGCAEHSDNNYYRNKPHTYPDLVATDASLPGIEIKTALLKNSPKGHQPKPGYYLIYRYCLTDENGHRKDGEKELWDTVTIWEIKFGYLSEDDFSCSNTEGDSGKTAVIRTASLNKMPLLYFNPGLVPYRHTSSRPYNGYN